MNILSLLFLAREYDTNSLFFKDYLCLDMFREIYKTTFFTIQIKNQFLETRKIKIDYKDDNKKQNILNKMREDWRFACLMFSSSMLMKCGWSEYLIDSNYFDKYKCEDIVKYFFQDKTKDNTPLWRLTVFGSDQNYCTACCENYYNRARMYDCGIEGHPIVRSKTQYFDRIPDSDLLYWIDLKIFEKELFIE